MENELNQSRQSHSSKPGSAPTTNEGQFPQLIKPTSRRAHRKTRTGCRTCKVRKIKCDETLPECKNCTKHSVRCDFTTSTAERPPLIFVNQTLGTPSNDGTPQSPRQSVPDTLNGSNGTQPSGLNLRDLELLHNFSTHTSSTLHGDPVIKTLIRTSIPQLGLQYEFVMRGVLAISALHLGRFKQDQREYYVAQALHHQEIGLRGASAIIPHMTEENCSAIYIFSVLTFYISLAKPRNPGDFFIVGDNGVADWLFLIKGTSYIMNSSMESLLAGPFGPLFEAGRRRHKLRAAGAEPMPDHDPVGELGALIQSTVFDPAQRAIYDDVIEGLRKAFAMNQGSSIFETGDVFAWVFQVSDGFLELLRQQTPESLAIMAYFCVLLKHLEHYWWVEGWSNHLISKIFNVLDAEHRLWIRWPIEEIGWIPN